jgi:threonine dehydrogenase-like Zn-dependent dehydrogenase
MESSSMRALVWTGAGDAGVRMAPLPVPGVGEALLRVTVAGICGTDVAGFLGRRTRQRPPGILGHEVAGAVVTMPAGEWPVSPGDQVVVDPVRTCGACAYCTSGRRNLCSDLHVLGERGISGAFAEYVAVPAASTYTVPRELAPHRSVLAEPLANAVHLLRAGRAGTPDLAGVCVAIWGAGVQGAFLVQLVRRWGCRRVAIVDPAEERLALARALGADAVFDGRGDAPAAVRAWSGGEGADLCIEAAGVADARRDVVRATRPGGQVRLLGLREPFGALDFRTVVRRELRIAGSFAYTPEDFRLALELLCAGAVDLPGAMHGFPLDAGPEALRKAAGPPGHVLKFTLAP